MGARLYIVVAASPPYWASIHNARPVFVARPSLHGSSTHVACLVIGKEGGDQCRSAGPKAVSRIVYCPARTDADTPSPALFPQLARPFRRWRNIAARQFKHVCSLSTAELASEQSVNVLHIADEPYVNHRWQKIVKC